MNCTDPVAESSLSESFVFYGVRLFCGEISKFCVLAMDVRFLNGIMTAYPEKRRPNAGFFPREIVYAHMHPPKLRRIGRVHVASAGYVSPSHHSTLGRSANDSAFEHRQVYHVGQRLAWGGEWLAPLRCLFLGVKHRCWTFPVVKSRALCFFADAVVRE